MPSQLPVFLFTFANDRASSLGLDEEWCAAEQALQRAEDSGLLNFNLTPSATMEDVFAKFQRFHQRIGVFHYGGHSDAEGLDLTDTVIKGQTLATLIGQEEHLQLVFLNGCSNAAQVEVLFEKGVPLVIATTAAVDDRRAILLTRHFYTSLAAGRTIQGAFDVAAAFLNNQEHSNMVATRGLDIQGAQLEIPWGLYVNSESALKWRIPEWGEQNKSGNTTINQQAEKIYNINKIDKADFS